MKKTICFILLILIVGCEKRNEIEVIPDYNALYLPADKVDVPIKILGNEEQHIEDIQKIVGENFKPDNKAYYFFKSLLYINEQGDLEKIKYSQIMPDKNFGDAEINPEIEKLYPRLTDYLSGLKFSPAMLSGRNVKSQFEWEASFKVDSSRNAEVYLMSLDLSGLKNLKFFKTDEYLEKVDEMPFPVGGMKALAQNVKYPEIAKRAGLQGRVFVKAFIDENGDVAGAEIIKGIGGGCDQAAIDAVKATKFTPGTKNGKPVKVQVSIPILFKLQ
jgi:protein TonB